MQGITERRGRPITVEEVRAELCRQDFGEYCKWVHGRELYRHQVAWIEAWERGSRVLIVAPPGTYKSTTVRMRIEWEIGNNIEGTHLLPMNTAAQAQRQVMSIAETLERNAAYRKVFPWVIPNPKRGWSHEMLFVRRGNEALPDATLYGTGWDGPYQGVHVDRIWPDDPTDQQDVDSPATMEQQRQRLRGVMVDRLNPGGRINGILTRWGENDLVRDFAEMQFRVITNPIEGNYPWGRLLCPEQFGDDRLQEIREGKGVEGPMSGRLYQLTYMCDPAGAEGALLKREWWRVYSVLPPLDLVAHFWDLSTGKSALGDYSAYQSWGAGAEGYYLVDAGRWRLGLDSLVSKMRLLYEQSRPRAQAVVVEDAGTSIPVVQYLKSHTRLPLVTVKPGTANKVARVQGIQGLVEAGRAWVPSAAPWLPEWMDELAAFPGGHYDDQVDAMSMGLAYLDKRTSGGDNISVQRWGGHAHAGARGRHQTVKVSRW